MTRIGKLLLRVAACSVEHCYSQGCTMHIAKRAMTVMCR